MIYWTCLAIGKCVGLPRLNYRGQALTDYLGAESLVPRAEGQALSAKRSVLRARTKDLVLGTQISVRSSQLLDLSSEGSIYRTQTKGLILYKISLIGGGRTVHDIQV